MSPSPAKEKDFLRFKEMLENDAKLKEIVDWVIAAPVPQQERRQLRIPYVSAPRLTETPWK